MKLFKIRIFYHLYLLCGLEEKEQEEDSREGGVWNWKEVRKMAESRHGQNFVQGGHVDLGEK